MLPWLRLAKMLVFSSQFSVFSCCYFDQQFGMFALRLHKEFFLKWCRDYTYSDSYVVSIAVCSNATLFSPDLNTSHNKHGQSPYMVAPHHHAHTLSTCTTSAPLNVQGGHNRCPRTSVQGCCTPVDGSPHPGRRLRCMGWSHSIAQTHRAVDMNGCCICKRKRVRIRVHLFVIKNTK